MDFFFSRAVMLKLATITHKQALYSWSTAPGTVKGPPVWSGSTKDYTLCILRQRSHIYTKIMSFRSRLKLGIFRSQLVIHLLQDLEPLGSWYHQENAPAVLWTI